MKTFKSILVVLAVALICAVVWAGDEKPWFDLKTCAYCKTFDLGNDDYIVDHMKGEYHDLPNGFLAIIIVEDAYKDKCTKANADMMKVSEEMQKTGAVPHLCGHCTAMGELMMTATSTDIKSDIAMIALMTSEKPEVVTKLHAFAQKNREEMPKWHAERAAAKAAKAEK